MNEISAKIFIEIWDKIARNEKLTDTGLCTKLGIHPGTIARWRDGKTETVRLKLAHLIQERLGYRLDLKDDGSIDLENPEKGWRPKMDAQAHRAYEAGAGSRREVLSFPLAANVRAIGGNVVLTKSGSFVPFTESELSQCFYLRVNDSSMEPVLFEGDALLVSRKTGRISEGLAAIVSKESTRIRRVVTEGKQVKLLVPNSLKNAELFNDAEEILCPILCTFHSRSESGQRQSEA